MSVDKREQSLVLIAEKISSKIKIDFYLLSTFFLFSRDSYREHTKCVSEQEKYGGANYAAPSNMNKGEKKQNQWFEIVQSGINLNTGSQQAKILLKRLQYYPNTPRKRAKFIVSLIIFFCKLIIFIDRILLTIQSKVFHLELSRKYGLCLKN